MFVLFGVICKSNKQKTTHNKRKKQFKEESQSKQQVSELHMYIIYKFPTHKKQEHNKNQKALLIILLIDRKD